MIPQSEGSLGELEELEEGSLGELEEGSLGELRPSSIVYRPSSIVYRPSSIVYRPSSIVYRPSSIVRYNPTMSLSVPDDPFWHTLRTRRSLRRYDGRPVSPPVLERLLTAATWAPNAHNRQPWRFAVVTDPDRRTRLAQALGQRWYADLLADGVTPAEAERRVALSQRRIGTAGALVLGCITMTVMDAYPDARRQRLEWLMAGQSLALALGQLLLAAHYEGLAACWMCAPLFAPDIVTAVLDLPPDWEPQALITLGHPDPSAPPPPPKDRLPLTEVVLWR